MQTLGSVASITASIREDAEAEVERIEEGLQKEIASLRAEAGAANVAIADRDARLAGARRENDERIAHQEWEGRRMAIEQREAWIGKIIAAAREPQRTSAAQLMALIREALQTIDAAEYEVAVADRDRHLVDIKKLGKKVRVTSADTDGGCIVTAGDVVFDNSFKARVRRLEPEWRNALCEVYRP